MLLHQLEVFTQVAEKSGFSKAAEYNVPRGLDTELKK